MYRHCNDVYSLSGRFVSKNIGFVIITMANCSFEAYHFELFSLENNITLKLCEAEEKFIKQRNRSANASKAYATARALHTQASSRTETQELLHGILYV